jgi:O-6-methylguanine DNA methyltransferase
MTQFQKDALEVVRKIPRGTTFSYKQVADLSGHPGAYRAVGSVLKQNFSADIPCHRVICSNGRPGKYNRGANKKIDLLKKEGVIT